MPDWLKVRSLMKSPLVIDGRGIFNKAELKDFTYLRIG